MNAFSQALQTYRDDQQTPSSLRRAELEILQVNLGNLCNQSCIHCHVNAGPHGECIMTKKVMDDIIRFLTAHEGLTLDITGGAPELNPHFDYLVQKARPLVKESIVRSNLTVIFEKGKGYLPEFYRKNEVHLICSLPCYQQENVDSQRGRGAFEKSIEALRLLNDRGYGTKKELLIDLVYNPVGAHLPPNQEALEKDYKKMLAEDHEVRFNRLIAIANVPINRFRHYIESTGEYEYYMATLRDHFNPTVLKDLMCRTFLSVGHDGRLYDCDFNQALGWAVQDEQGALLTIEKLSLPALEGKEILVGEHCFSCTAGSGSSCKGALSA